MTLFDAPPQAVAMSLRPYQVQAIAGAQEHHNRGVTGILIVCPTGGGKTVIAASIIANGAANGMRFLFLAHRRELINQTFNKLLAMGVPRAHVGVIMAGDHRRNPGAVIQVASVDTIRNRAKPKADIVFIDECHRCYSPTYRAIATHYKAMGSVVLGLTATPYRADGNTLHEMFDEMVVVAQPRELIAQGFLVEPRIFTLHASQMPDLTKVATKGGDYDEKELAEAIDRDGLVGNIVEHWERYASQEMPDGSPLRTVVFAVNVAHSQHIAQRFRDAGHAAEHIDGTMDTAERDAVLARLESGETRIVTNCAVLTEGWDMPSVKCCVLARPTKSKGLYIQMAGRVLRPWQNVGALILDHSGNALAHGLPQDDQEYSLEPKKKRDKQARIPSKQCGSCFAIVPPAAKICPQCGAEFSADEIYDDALEEKEGELVEVRAASLEEKRATYNELVDLGKARGYASGWASHQYLERFGVWPPNAWKDPVAPNVTASIEVKRAEFDKLRSMQRENGYKPGFVGAKFKAKFGHWPPQEWSRAG